MDGGTLMSMTSVFDKVRGRAETFAVAFVLVVAAGVYASIALLTYTSIDGIHYYSLNDDPMISMRYARNLAEGHGLRWNIGELPVEGYTNLLWTLLMAAVHMLPIHESKISLVIIGLSSLLLLVNAVICCQLVRRLEVSSAAVIFTAILAAFYWPLVMWASDGFEVGLIACLMSAGILATFGDLNSSARDIFVLTLVLVALVLARPDCILPVLVLIGALGVRARQGKVSWWCVSLACSVVLFTEISVTAWRWYYYGEFLPNTYYLKAIGVPLSDRLPKGLLALWGMLRSALWGILLLAIPGSILMLRAGHRTLVATVWTLFGFACLYTVYLGGDTWERTGITNRFIAQAVSPLFVCVAIFIDSVRKPRVLGGAALLLVALISTHSLNAIFNRVRSVAAMVHSSVKDGAPLRLKQGLWLRANARSGDAVGAVWAGAIPYFSRLPSYDLLGKSDPLIARLKPRGMVWGHNKWSNRYTLEVRRPRFIQQLWRPTVEENREAEALQYRINQVGILEGSDPNRE